MQIVKDINSVTQCLLEDLKGFGLNPQDWNLYSSSTNQWLISSKEDPDFLFQGKCQRKGTQWKWEHVQLISL